MAAVLLVDDERDFTDLLSERLEARGLTTLKAYSGEEALARLEGEDVDVVVLDVNMPGLGGLQTLSRIKELRPQVEVILLTGESGVDTAVGGMKRGARDYLVKPVSVAVLQHSIQEARRRRLDRLGRLRMAETAKLAALGELAKGVAHEINNPVNIMLNEAGWIEDLLEEKEFQGSPHRAEMVRAVSRIHAQAERCKAITSKLLTLRRSVDQRRAETDLGELAAKIAAGLKERAGRQNVRLSVDIAEEASMLPVNPAELEEVLSNLADNALDAMEDGGALGLTARVDGGQAVIEVTDTGRGMDAALLARIFEPFFSTKEVGKGTGLGLAICHSLVESMGGEIAVQSDPGKGARFSLRLPLTRAGNGDNG